MYSFLPEAEAEYLEAVGFYEELPLLITGARQAIGLDGSKSNSGLNSDAGKAHSG